MLTKPEEKNVLGTANQVELATLRSNSCYGDDRTSV